MFSKVALISQVAGSAAIAVGVGLVFVPAGVVVAGVFAVLFGIALERRDAK